MRYLIALCLLVSMLPGSAAAQSAGDQIVINHKWYSVQHAKIDVAGADSDQIVAAVTAKKPWVMGFFVVCDGPAVVTFEDSDGTDLSGPMAVAANGGVSAPPSAFGYFVGTAGKALHLNKSAAVNCGGAVTYAEVD